MGQEGKCPEIRKTCLITRRKNVPLVFVYLVTKSYCIHNGQFQSNITFLEFICLSFKFNMWVKMWRFMVFKISIKECINKRWFSNSSLPWKKQRYIFTSAQDGWEKTELQTLRRGIPSSLKSELCTKKVHDKRWFTESLAEHKNEYVC